jgi:hypothetical protein
MDKRVSRVIHGKSTPASATEVDNPCPPPASVSASRNGRPLRGPAVRSITFESPAERRQRLFDAGRRANDRVASGAPLPAAVVDGLAAAAGLAITPPLDERCIYCDQPVALVDRDERHIIEFEEVAHEHCAAETVIRPHAGPSRGPCFFCGQPVSMLDDYHADPTGISHAECWFVHADEEGA